MVGKEPAVVFGAISELLRQLIPMLIVFGFINWTDVQIGAVFSFSSAVIAVLTVLLTRAASVSTETANKQIEVAVKQPIGTPVEKVIEIAKET